MMPAGRGPRLAFFRVEKFTPEPECPGAFSRHRRVQRGGSAIRVGPLTEPADNTARTHVLSQSKARLHEMQDAVGIERLGRRCLAPPDGHDRLCRPSRCRRRRPAPRAGATLCAARSWPS